MSKYTIMDQALDSLATDAGLYVNKTLLRQYGGNMALFVGNLVDKLRYFKGRGMLQKDGSFFLTHEQQMEQLGTTLYDLRKCKKQLKDLGILTTKLKGQPAKEFYLLNTEALVNSLILFRNNHRTPNSNENDIPEVRGNENITMKGNENSRTYKENKVKENKNNNICKMTRNKQKHKKTIDPVKPEQSSNLVKYIVPSQFDAFWELYPKKISKKETKKKWEQICKWPVKDRPTWREIKKAILLQKKTPLWQDRQRIKNPKSWLHNSRWDMDPKEMTWNDWGNNKSSLSSSNNKRKPVISNVDPKDILLDGIVIDPKNWGTADLWHSQAPSLLNQAAKLCNCDKASKLKLAKNFNTMYHDILDERSENGKHFKNPQTIIERYIDWLRDGKGEYFGKEAKPHLFDINATVFTRYFIPWLMTDNFDFNPITGKMDDTGCPYASR